MKVMELIFVAPWVVVIAVGSIDDLREFWMDLRSHLVCRDSDVEPYFGFTQLI